MLGLADCAITAQPDAKDLAGIAISSAETAKALLGWEPRVALLSFSTCGSSEHESLEVVRKAVGIVRRLRPELKVDGEFQLDSAILPEVAAKRPFSIKTPGDNEGIFSLLLRFINICVNSHSVPHFYRYILHTDDSVLR
jgi:phosphotransacetylase